MLHMEQETLFQFLLGIHKLLYIEISFRIGRQGTHCHILGPVPILEQINCAIKRIRGWR